MDENEKLNAIKTKKLQFLQNGLKLLEIVKPRFYLPFAGMYTLAGKFYTRNPYRGETDIDEGAKYLQENFKNPNSKCIMLNQNEYFDFSTYLTSKSYIPIDQKKKQDYIKDILSKKKYDYEYDPIPKKQEIVDLAKQAFLRFEIYRKKIDFSSNTVILIEFSEKIFIKLSSNGESISFISKQESQNEKKYIKIFLDPRLLKRLLQGPKYAHWQVADGGSHLTYDRFPNNYERGLNYCLCYFHN